jgi:hypothetical protein
MSTCDILRTLKCDNLPGPQHHVRACRWIPASKFFYPAEFAKAGGQHIFAGFQGSFDEFEQYFDCFMCFLLGLPVGFNNGFDNARFSEVAGFWH